MVLLQRKKIRKQMAATDKDGITDRVWRSYGLLKCLYAFFNELLNLISDIKIGEDLGLINIGNINLNKLLVETSPAHT